MHFANCFLHSWALSQLFNLCNQNLRRGLGTRLVWFGTTYVVSLVLWPHAHHGPHTHTLEGKIPTIEGLFHTCQSIVPVQRQHSLSHQMHQALSSGRLQSPAALLYRAKGQLHKEIPEEGEKESCILIQPPVLDKLTCS